MARKDIDLSDSKLHKVFAWTCAGIGAYAGVHFVAAASIGGAIAAGVGGAIAGAAILPAAITLTGVAGFLAIKGAAKFIANEGPFIPLAAVMVGYASLRAIAEPFAFAGKKIGALFSKKTTPGHADAVKTVPESVNAPAVAGKGIKSVFETVKAGKIRPLREPGDYDDVYMSPGLTD